MLIFIKQTSHAECGPETFYRLKTAIDQLCLGFCLVLGLLLGSVVVKSFFRSRDQDRDLDHQVSRLRPRRGQNELESRDHGLEITSLLLGLASGNMASDGH